MTLLPWLIVGEAVKRDGRTLYYTSTQLEYVPDPTAFPRFYKLIFPSSGMH